jgi:phosphoribosylaminoimidazole-succinocarboxamide synthase
VKQETRIRLYKKSGKTYYQTDTTDFIIQDFNSSSSPVVKKLSKKNGLDVLRNTISCYLFEYLEEFRIATHFAKKHSGAEMLVRTTEAIPLIFKVFNLNDGAFVQRFHLAEGVSLEFPVIEHYYVMDESTTTWVNEYHVYALGIATPEEFKQMNRLSSKANAVIRGLCDRRQLTLAEIQFSFGRSKGQIVLTDELSPMTCRFIDREGKDESSRHRFYHEHERADDAIAELCDRLMLKV